MHTTTPVPFEKLGFQCKHNWPSTCNFTPSILLCEGEYRVSGNMCLSDITFTYLVSSVERNDRATYRTGDDISQAKLGKCFSPIRRFVSTVGNYYYYLDENKSIFVFTRSPHFYDVLSVQWKSNTCLKATCGFNVKRD